MPVTPEVKKNPVRGGLSACLPELAGASASAFFLSTEEHGPQRAMRADGSPLLHTEGDDMLNSEIIRNTNHGRKRAVEIDDGQQWLTELKQRIGKEHRITEVFYLSPSRARALLVANPDNRKISNRTAETYATDIANGRWVFNGEPIIIAETGELNDGQHRCEAVVLAGKGIEVLLVAGVPRSSRTTVDMGKVRTTGDFLHMHGIENANIMAAAAAMILACETGRIMGGGGGVKKDNNNLATADLRPTKQEVLTFARANMDDLHRAQAAIRVDKASVVASYSRFIGILAILARRSKDWDEAIAYISAVVDGDGIKKTTPEYTVRERLIKERSTKTLGAIAFMEIVVRGWNARRSRQRLSHIKLAGYVPEIAR